MGKCLDMAGPVNETGSNTVFLYTCNGTSPQKWEPRTDGTIIGLANGFCLDGTYGTPGSPITTHPCHGGTNQTWTKPTFVS
jgi:hypothetical protein